METENKKLISPAGLLLDLVLSGIFFVVFTTMIMPSHVPEYDPFWNTVWSAFASLPLTLVFFFAACYFRVTLIDFNRRQKS